VRSFFVFHLLRRYPAWAGWLPAHTPRLTLAMPATQHAKPTAEVAADQAGPV
jgi:cardiolipin synthase